MPAKLSELTLRFSQHQASKSWKSGERDDVASCSDWLSDNKSSKAMPISANDGQLPGVDTKENVHTISK